MRSSRARFRGTPEQVGREIGRHYGRTILESLAELRACLRRHGATGPQDAAVTGRWFEALPGRYRQELHGVAAELGCPVLELVETCAGWEEAPSRGCTSFIAAIDGAPWVGRNNDYLLPLWWDHAMVRDIPGRLSTLALGLPGDAFTGTGINEARLWLHTHWLPAPDRPQAAERWTPFVWLREALETCATIADVESLLSATERDQGMALFAVDGKARAAALFECTCRSHLRADFRGPPLVAANHYQLVVVPGAADEGSRSRQDRLERALRAAPGREAFAAALALAAVGEEGSDLGTVYSALADPAGGRIWYAADAFPAPLEGRWAPLEWPW